MDLIHPEQVIAAIEAYEDDKGLPLKMEDAHLHIPETALSR